MAVYEIQNLTYYYPESNRPAIRDVDLQIEEGEFVLLVGPSGCGKSSLLRTLNGLIPDYYGGKIAGNITFEGKDLLHSKEKNRLGQCVGTVFQDPEEQLVLTNVEREIAFGLENLGLPNPVMKRRVAEVINFLDLEDLKDAATPFLSGGQKQKVVLASVLVMQPRVLLLDEPTSQLDPVNAEGFLNIVKRLNEEMGFTIVLVEQRLERCFHLANRIIAMEDGQIVCDCTPGEYAHWAVKTQNAFIPPVARFFAALGLDEVPLTVKDGRKALREYDLGLGIKGVLAGGNNCVHAGDSAICNSNVAGFRGGDTLMAWGANVSGNGSGRVPATQNGKAPAIRTKNLWFSYKPEKEVLKGIDVSFSQNEIIAILGQNGTGKSTFLKTLNGLLKPQRGSVWVNDFNTKDMGPEDLSRFVGYLSQNPNDYLFNDTVQEEIEFTLNSLGIGVNGNVAKVLKLLQLEGLKKKNPRDLSGGERQRVALASVLAPEPDILLLDEPTRGMDFHLKSELGGLLQELCIAGKTTVLVTHDIEFAVEYADRVVLLFDGEIVADGNKHEILSQALFYSGQINKLFRGYEDNVLTFAEALSKVGGVRGVRV